MKLITSINDHIQERETGKSWIFIDCSNQKWNEEESIEEEEEEDEWEIDTEEFNSLCNRHISNNHLIIARPTNLIDIAIIENNIKNIVSILFNFYYYESFQKLLYKSN
ncbi:hypothetical protein DFA_12353 [Cavenderia fasciculata]|uniref:Uncharacterized protein n=1 Tax=Cavenderia fasciculata TaxID=261658 RepID=F4QDF8_CACFS|nr:uncharacterized protein DFA_12353 [Cavenderia fasciculata]EGG14576.1 hypothetical protein DFA_12353 [Cavenderia fasciculata]|eukprot:XP_004366096.1 hypothetical protein DFA_12353 [Cavenderia fasciculata]